MRLVAAVVGVVVLGVVTGVAVLSFAQADKGAEGPPGVPETAGAWLGVEVAPLDEDMAEIAGTDEGVLINTLIDDSPAAEAGLMAGDVVTRLSDTKVDDPDQFVRLIRRHIPGDRIKVVYYRMGKRGTATVRLGRKPARPAWPEGRPGIDLPPDLRRQLEEIMPGLLDRLREMEPRLRRWERRFETHPDPEYLPVPVPEEEVDPYVPEAERDPGYRIGRDIGRIMEKLDRLEKRMDRLERRVSRLEKKE